MFEPNFQRTDLMIDMIARINDLNELASHGLLIVEGAGPSTRYRVVQAEM